MDSAEDDVKLSIEEVDELEYEYYSNESEADYTYDEYGDEIHACSHQVVQACVRRGESALFGHKSKKKGSTEYQNLDFEQLTRRKDIAVSQLVEILCVERDEAQILLRHYNWDQGRAESDWFSDESSVREVVGIPSAALSDEHDNKVSAVSGSLVVVNSGTKRQRLGSNASTVAVPGKAEYLFCAICLEETEGRNVSALKCAHSFCKVCWGNHINLAISEGPSSTELSCPHPKCNTKVPETFIRQFCRSIETFEKWKSYMVRSFVDFNRSARWCPQPGCELAVEYPGGGVIEVLCPCPNNSQPHFFCFGCGMEAHRPASCKDAKRWVEKNSTEAENVTWIMANTKQCPKCHLNIEKNQGCNHMTCRKQTGGCGHEFCWLCLEAWSEHGAQTGGYYNCNKYEADKKKKLKLLQDESARAAAKHHLDRYMHFFERFNNNNRARKFADRSMAEIQVKRELLHEVKGYRIEETVYMVEAAKCIIDSRRVLKWTYVFGYYLENEQERPLFQNLQEMLEKFTETLHELVETPLDKFLQEGVPRKEFDDHRALITNLLSSTDTYKNNLLEGIDNGLTNF